MKSHTEYIVFETKKRREMVHITDQVQQIVRKSGVNDGLCFVSPMHITAAIYVNDLEGGLIEDIAKWLEELAPARPDYKHHRTGEDNADAHLKALLLHHETTLPVTNGKLDLGTWQRVFYAEFDGQRPKGSLSRSLEFDREDSLQESALSLTPKDRHLQARSTSFPLFSPPSRGNSGPI